jgi:hypothetical protein
MSRQNQLFELYINRQVSIHGEAAVSEMTDPRDSMPVENRAALKRTRGSGLAQQSGGGQHSVMQRVLQNLDIMRHTFHLMPASVLLRCTLVCRSFRATIDTGVTGEFERHLRWTGFFMDKWASTNGALCCVDFDAERSALRASVHVAQQAVQYMWRLNVIPKVENYVYMHMRMYLPLAHVNVSGDPKRIERLQAQGDVSIDVRKWQIVEKQQDGDSTGAVPGSLGRLQLKAVWFAHNSPVKLQVDHDILVDFHNVPVDPQALNYRSLCVMRCVLVCMHCHQRSPKWQSLDVKHAHHRVLCSICYETLYVPVTQLQSKWKIREKMRLQAASRAHFVHRQVHLNHRVSPDTPVEGMLKQEVAELLDYTSWAALLHGNHRRSNASQQIQHRFSFFSR